ncbi:MAG: hypothetical protein ABIG90_01570, partial [bacterium]
MNQEKIFVYNDEKNLGQLYILGKVRSGSQEEQSYLANLIASTIRREYYDYPERKPLEALKASLQKANVILERFNKKANFICAVLYRGRLYLTQTKGNCFARINKAKFEALENYKPFADSYQASPLPLTEPKRFWAYLNIDNFQKALIGFYLIFIIIFSSAVYISQNKEEKQQIINYQNVLSQAKQKFLQAEAVLMFNQNDRAKTLLEESQNILTSLPDLPDKINLNQQIAEQINKSNKLTEINNIKSIKSGEPISGIVKIQKNIYAFDSSNNAIYQINDLIKPVSTTSVNLGYIQKAVVFQPEDIIVFLTNTPGLAIYTPNKNLSKSQVDLPSVLIKDISSYNQFIYALGENQIYRYSRTLAGFSGPYSWLKQKTDFVNPISMAIDGDIYVLDNDQVLKFFRGIREDFNLNLELNQPIKIFTLPNLNNLYVLEKNRLLVFDKTGQLISQITSAQFTNLKDIWVDKDKTIY